MDATTPASRPDAIPVPAIAGGADALQFDTVAALGGAAMKSCSACASPIPNEYHMAYGNVVCRACRLRLQAGAQGSGFARVMRAAAFGFGAAVAAAAITWAIGAATGLYIGYVYVLVGFMVGRAVVKGGSRGRRYQLMAAAMAYVSVAISYAPYAFGSLHGTSGYPALVFYPVAAVMTLFIPVFVVKADPLSVIFTVAAMVVAWRQPRGPEGVITGPYFLYKPQPAAVDVA